MSRFGDLLAAVMLTAWVGGLWAIGYLAAPVLFWKLPGDTRLAGNLAGTMFSIMSWVGIVSGFYLLIHRLARFGASALRQLFFWTTLCMLLLTLGGYFGIQPVIESLKAQAFPREVMQSAFSVRFARWHGIASIVYLIESLLGLVLVVRARQS